MAEATIIFAALLLLPFLFLGLWAVGAWFPVVRASLAALFGALLFAAGAMGALFLLSRQQEAIFISLPWAQSVGVLLQFRADSFSLWFAFLIYAIGSGIFLYSCAYFKESPAKRRFLAVLSAFAGAMIGILFADNVYLLFIFWELTSLCSFMLIGHYYEKSEVRAKALQSLYVTALGGMALLVGFILLHQLTGEANLSEMVLSAEMVAGPTFPAILVCILIGCFTKSAQFPFHFWLPNAMAGPTPVSAYLHSATMVKAGVFLLAQISPLFAFSHWWKFALIGAGTVTAVLAVIWGMRQVDLKALLASMTLGALGVMTVLLGVGTETARVAFVLFLTAHALYKAPLFLLAGVVEKIAGTRNVTELGGIGRSYPLLAGAGILSFLSVMGLAPWPGYLGKEYALKALWAELPVLAVVIMLVLAGMIAIGLKVVYLPFFSKTPGRTEQARVALSPSLIGAVLIPTTISALLALGVIWALPAIYQRAFFSLAGDYSLSLWPGWTAPLYLSLTAWAIGLGTFWIVRKREFLPSGLGVAERVYHGIFRYLTQWNGWITAMIQHRSLRVHALIVFGSVISLLSFMLVYHSWSFPPLTFNVETPFFAGIAMLISTVAWLSIRANSKAAGLIYLGVVGLGVTFFFVFFSAPDLALTQLLVETLLIVLLGVVFWKFPESKKRAPSSLRWFQWLVSVSGGVVISLLVLKSLSVEIEEPVSTYYLEQSYVAAFGKNVVNVILVDFRALDTFGEVIVLTIAVIAMGALFTANVEGARGHLVKGQERFELLEIGVKWAVPLLFILAFFLLIRGHNDPGGGFIAGLIATLGWTLRSFARVRGEVSPEVITPTRLIVGGFLCILISMLPGLMTGGTLLEGRWLPSIYLGDTALHLGTPLVFDVGVFFIVWGFGSGCLGVFQRAKELVRRPTWS